jgi:ribosomal peptide maturation radical SAM protein 1
MPKGRLDVLLVTAPWAELEAPSIQLSILKPIVEEMGLTCEVEYANLIFGAMVGPAFYRKFAVNRHLMFLGERMFSEIAFGKGLVNQDLDLYLNYINDTNKEFAEASNSQENRTYLELIVGKEYREIISRTIKRDVPRFMSKFREVVKKKRPRVVGFTSTFNQNVASLAMAKIVKQDSPDTFVIMGGANCEGPMGKALLSLSGDLDCVVSGEGEETIKSVLQRVIREEKPPDLSGIDGIIYRQEGQFIVNKTASLITDFSHFPPMVCDDYFNQIEDLRGRYGFVIPQGPVKFEASRGCWWGQRSQCTFCGLNGTRTRYRVKSQEKVLEELVAIARRFRRLDFMATDNILNTALIPTLLRKLKELPYRLNLTLEIKATLTRAQVAELANSGVVEVQPGIESLSSHTLKLMRKGTSMLQNIQILKWLTEYSIGSVWNLLYGFPGETDGDFLSQHRLIPLIRHLQPPAGGRMFRIEMHRFSPNYDERFVRGFFNVKPLKDYSFVYPDKPEILSELSYFFEYELGGEDRRHEELVKYINEEIKKWVESKSSLLKPVLIYQPGPGFFHITDTRSGQKVETDLIGYAREILLLCDRIMSYDGIVKALRTTSTEVDERRVQHALGTLVEKGLIIEENRNYLSLCVPYNHDIRGELTQIGTAR